MSDYYHHQGSQMSGMTQNYVQTTPELKRELIEAFKMLDTEKKGYLNTKEMRVDDRLHKDRHSSLRVENKSKRTR